MPGLRMTLLLTVLTGMIYPGVVTGLCQVLFSNQANGSLITRHGKIVGSALIGQNFSKAEYFQPRPSAAGNDGYDATASSGSNFGPTSQKLMDRVKGSVQKIKAENPSASGVLLVAAFAVFHGHAHGAEMSRTSSGLAYGAGFVAATASLHAVGIALGLALKKLDKPRVFRLAGAAAAAYGVALLLAK